MTEPATITPAPPLRGRQMVARGAAVRITIPGRPQAKERTHDGRLLEAAKTFMDHVRDALRPTVPTPLAGPVRVDLHFIYTSPTRLPLTLWPSSNIPNADTAATLTMRALAGVLVHHKSQINPLTITRTVLDPDDCHALHGSPHGATIITWET